MGCGGSAFSSTDGGSDGGADVTVAVDGSEIEASVPEAGLAEAGMAESGVAESGVAESGVAEGGVAESGVAEGGLPTGAAVPCSATATCSGATPVCCLEGDVGTCVRNNLSCACETQLECASDLDCQLPTGACCANKRNDTTCSTGHVVARCATACLGGTTQLCDPSATQAECATGTCMNDPADLQGAGLPNDPLYGVCK
jgi:hypothetical protein